MVYQCDICEAKCETSQGLGGHRFWVHGKREAHGVVGKGVKKPRKRRKRRYSRRRVTCPDCGQSFATRAYGGHRAAAVRYGWKDHGNGNNGTKPVSIDEMSVRTIRALILRHEGQAQKLREYLEFE